VSNGGNGGPIIDRTRAGPLANMNLTELDEARGIANYKPSARLKQSSALVGDVAARDFIRLRYGPQARQIVMRRANKVPVFDHLYEIRKGEFIVAEGKANQSPLGRTNRKSRVWKAGAGGTRVAETTTRGAVIQFSPEWFEQRLVELRRDFGPEGRRLANQLEHAWREGKLHPAILRAPEANRTAEYVVDRYVTQEWNDYIGRARPDTITDPARMLGAPPSNVDRGLEAAERVVVPHAEPHLSKPRLSTAEHLGEGAVKVAARGFKARSLVIGVKAWRAARTLGNFAFHCFIPMTPLDILIEVTLWLGQLIDSGQWPWEREKEEKKRREKQRALEAVFKEGGNWIDKAFGKKPPPSLSQLIDRNILKNAKVQDQFMKDWDGSKGFNGFQYARVTAIMRIENYRDMRGEDDESRRSYSVESRDVYAVNVGREFELEDIGEEQEVEKTEAEIKTLLNEKGAYASSIRKMVMRKRLRYTIVPPLLTPYDIVIAKMNNLFVDIVQFTAAFTGAGGEILTKDFSFDYRYPEWQTQFEVMPDFAAPPLNRSVCEYCLGYLYYSAKLLSRHPLEQQDLEGNFEAPRKGWKRRLGLLTKLLEGSNSSYSDNFSRFAQQVKRLVRRGEKDEEIVAALDELYGGARAIWYDLERIEKNLHQPEYYYFGPQYVPSD